MLNLDDCKAEKIRPIAGGAGRELRSQKVAPQGPRRPSGTPPRARPAGAGGEQGGQRQPGHHLSGKSNPQGKGCGVNTPFLTNFGKLVLGCIESDVCI